MKFAANPARSGTLRGPYGRYHWLLERGRASPRLQALGGWGAFQRLSWCDRWCFFSRKDGSA